MSLSFNTLLIIVGVLLVVLLYIWGLFNSLVKKRNQVKTDLSDIGIQLKRKADLVDNLVALVREYAKHEKETFENVAKARSAVDTSKTAGQAAKAENMLTQTLKSLFAVAEEYPKLMASENYRDLRTDLKETENLIAHYREEYNRTVQELNNSVQTFPNLLVANLLGFAEEEFYEVNE